MNVKAVGDAAGVTAPVDVVRRLTQPADEVPSRSLS